MATQNRLTSWSYSRWKLWDQCPARAYYKYIKKLPEPGSAAMDRGTAVHKLLENYIRGAVPRLTNEMNPTVFGTLLKDLRQRRKRDEQAVFLEETWAYRSDWTMTRWDDWDRCWLRVKIDAASVEGNADHIKVGIHDFKTGKYRDQQEADYELQLSLYGLGALTKYQDAVALTVTPFLEYIDEGVTYAPDVYTKADLPRLRKEWEQRVKPMLSDTTFAPKPSNLCKFCSYSSAKNGPCKF